MAHTIQTYSGRAVLFTDLDLVAIVAAVLERIEEHTAGSSMAALADSWRKSLESYGTGVLPLRLDQLLPSTSDAAQLISTLEAVRAEVASYGAAVPAAVLNAWVKGRGVRYCDYDAERLVGTLQRFIELVAGRPVPNLSRS
jgi:hypothetical protein